MSRRTTTDHFIAIFDGSSTHTVSVKHIEELKVKRVADEFKDFTIGLASGKEITITDPTETMHFMNDFGMCIRDMGGCIKHDSAHS